jgi:hypothetical protein
MATRGKTAGLIEEALYGVATDVTCAGDRRWQFVLASGSFVPVQARLTDAWLELTTNVPQTTAFGIDAHSWLRFNAGLDGPVRAVCGLQTERVRLSADLNIEDDVTVVERVAWMCDEIGAALRRCQVEHDLAVSPLAPGQNHTGTDDIAQLCAEAGWPAAGGAAGGLRIDLDSGVGSAAYLDRKNSAALRMIVELADVADYSRTSLEAVGLVLLAVSASVRSVKGLLVEREGAECAALATAAPWPNSAAALNRSLSALAVACQAVWREVPALRDESLARAYVERWNLPRSSDNRVVNSNVIKEEHACLQQQ